MAEPSPKLRVVGDGEPPPRRGRGRGPGLAVIFVGLYALLFAGALWFLRAQVPRRRQAAADGAAAPAVQAARPDRQSLLSAQGLAPAARSEYLRELAGDCCDCGCDLRLHECLVGDEKCARSAEIAERRLERYR